MNQRRRLLKHRERGRRSASNAENCKYLVLIYALIEAGVEIHNIPIATAELLSLTDQKVNLIQVTQDVRAIWFPKNYQVTNAIFSILC